MQAHHGNDHEVDERDGEKLEESLPCIIGVAVALGERICECREKITCLRDEEHHIQNAYGSNCRVDNEIADNTGGVEFICALLVIEHRNILSETVCVYHAENVQRTGDCQHKLGGDERKFIGEDPVGEP